MTNQEKFLTIKDRYCIAYQKCNGKTIEVFYIKGWIYLERVSKFSNKVRLSKFEEMASTLESRIN